MALYCYQDALEDYDFVLSKEPGREELYARRAFLRAMLAGFNDVARLKAAEHDLQQSPGQNGDDLLLRATRGMISIKREDYGHAIGDLSWALEHGLSHAGIRYYRALARFWSGEFLPAIADLEQVTKEQPTFFRAFCMLGDCRVRTGKAEQALGDYANALKLQPDNFEILCDHISTALEINKYEVALADLDRLVALHPDFAWCYALRGLLHWLEGKDGALVRADIDRAAELDPQEWSFHACRAALQYQHAQYAKALGSLGRTGLVLRRTEFKPWWDLVRFGNGHGYIRLGVSWSYEGSDHNPNDGAKPADLEHKLADLGIKALWASGMSCLRVN